MLMKVIIYLVYILSTTKKQKGVILSLSMVLDKFYFYAVYDLKIEIT